MCTTYDTFQLGTLSDGTYQFHFKLFMSNTGQLEDSITTVFTVGSVGIEEISGIEQNLYPNPTEGKIILNTSDLIPGEEIEFRVFSIQGIEVKHLEIEVTPPELQIDLSELPAGNYLYEYHQNGSQIKKSGKIVLIKR